MKNNEIVDILQPFEEELSLATRARYVANNSRALIEAVERVVGKFDTRCSRCIINAYARANSLYISALKEIQGKLNEKGKKANG